MNRFSMLLATAILAAPTPSLAEPPVTIQQHNPELIEFCYGLMDSGAFPTLNLGECMSFNLTSIPGFTAHFCDFVRESDAYADFGFESYSDCVRSFEL